jgi:hypothetical protein
MGNYGWYFEVVSEYIEYSLSVEEKIEYFEILLTL